MKENVRQVRNIIICLTRNSTRIGMEANKKKRNPELRVMGVSPKTKIEINNIAKNFNMTTSSFLKQKLREIVDSYPERLRQAPTDY